MEPSSDDRSAVEIQRLREALNLAPEQVDISALVPIFVPGAFCALGNWPGPYSLLRAKDLGLTWSVVLPNQTMRYVDRRLEEHWDSRGIQWKTLALKNLSDITMKIGTHEFRREDRHNLCRRYDACRWDWAFAAPAKRPTCEPLSRRIQSSDAGDELWPRPFQPNI